MIIAIWCRSLDGVIAADGKIPFFSKQDKRFFYRICKLGKVVIGKNTYNDILKNNPKFIEKNDIQVLDTGDNLEKITYKKHLIVAGGSDIYYAFLKQNLVDVVYDCVFNTTINIEKDSKTVNNSLGLLKKFKLRKSFRIDKNVFVRKFLQNKIFN